MGRREWTVGVDFGATNIKVGLVSRQGKVVANLILLTREHVTPAAFVDGVHQAIERLASRVGARRAQVRGVGVGAPGLIDARRGIVHQLVNVRGGWRGVPLRRVLERRLRVPCAVDNDVNVVALGEWKFGAGKGTRHSVYLTLGTGVGGGLVMNGQLVRGASGSAGEIGHMVIRPNGPRCACGNRGCLESMVGTAAILRKARRAIRARRRGILARLATREQGRLTPALVSRAARAGDQAARRIWQELGEDLGLALANLVNLLSPQRIVIGGGMARAWPYFAPRLMATIRELAFEVPANACRIVRATLLDHAGIVGGAVLVWEQYGSRL